MNILSLPECMLEEVFSYLSYDEIAKKRIICSQVNKICQNLLNRGFSKMIKKHTINLKKIKSQLPRRESERRHHPLSKHADILTCIETRISMLSMTYTKYIDLNLCCFIPGKVIDEVFHVLQLVESTIDQTKSQPLRAHEVLQELRDISSMAIDHFDEKIAHILKKSYCDFSTQKFSSTIYQIMQSPIETALVMQQDFGTVDGDTSTLSVSGTSTSGRDHEQQCRIEEQLLLKNKELSNKLNRVVRLQQKQHTKIIEMKGQITDLRRRLDESDSKNREITAKIGQLIAMNPLPDNPSGNSVGGGGSSSNSSSSDALSQHDSTNKRFRNMKPRSASATIILKRITEDNDLSATTVKRPKLD